MIVERIDPRTYYDQLDQLNQSLTPPKTQDHGSIKFTSILTDDKPGKILVEVADGKFFSITPD